MEKSLMRNMNGGGSCSENDIALCQAPFEMERRGLETAPILNLIVS